MKHVWSVLCETSIRDEESRRTSIINSLDVVGFIMDKDFFEKNKRISTNLQIVSLWSNSQKDNEGFSIRIDLCDDKGRILVKTNEDVSGDFNKARSVITKVAINFLPVTSPGIYFFKVNQKSKAEKKYKLVAELPLEVKIKYNEEK
jgi:hypothetical protein